MKILHRVPALAAGNVHDVQEQSAAVDVPQEIVSQSRAFRRALDDAGDVRHNEGHALIHVDDPKVGIQCGKMVVGDFRVGVGGDGKQGGFSHVGEAHQSHVRQQL